MDATVSTKELKAKIDGNESVIVVETLAPERYREAHIPGALNIPPERIKELASQLLPNKDAEIVTYCANNHWHASAYAARELAAMGYSNVAHYPEGKQGWMAAGLPVAKGAWIEGWSGQIALAQKANRRPELVQSPSSNYPCFFCKFPLLYSREAMRRFLLVLAFLFSSLSLVAQKAESSSHSSGNAQAAKPSTPATAGSSSGHCPLVPNPENDAPPHGKVTPGRIIHRVNPRYPKELRKAHIEGTVMLCATIGIDGKLHNLSLLSGPTELVPYTREAVEKWLYQPYRVNDEPVAVDSEISVNFTLH